MRIEFNCKTNKDYVMINTAIFHLKDGGELTIDRDETEWSINEDGTMSMLFNGIYFWALNDCDIFTDEKGYGYYPSNENIDDVKRLLSAAIVEFELEDDADADYEVECIDYIVD